MVVRTIQTSDYQKHKVELKDLDAEIALLKNGYKGKKVQRITSGYGNNEVLLPANEVLEVLKSVKFLQRFQ